MDSVIQTVATNLLKGVKVAAKRAKRGDDDGGGERDGGGEPYATDLSFARARRRATHGS